MCQMESTSGGDSKAEEKGEEIYECLVDMEEVCRNRYLLYVRGDEDPIQKAISGKSYFDGIQEFIGDPQNVTLVSKKLIERKRDE